MINDVEYPIPKFLDQLFGIGWPDTFDQSTSQILFDSFFGCRFAGFDKLRFELHAVIAVLHPFAFSGEPFAGGYRCCIADHRNQIPTPFDLNSHHAKSCFLVVISDPLDESGNTHVARFLVQSRRGTRWPKWNPFPSEVFQRERGGSE